jgi:hypothetical protein
MTHSAVFETNLGAELQTEFFDRHPALPIVLLLFSVCIAGTVVAVGTGHRAPSGSTRAFSVARMESQVHLLLIEMLDSLRRLWAILQYRPGRTE